MTSPASQVVAGTSLVSIRRAAFGYRGQPVVSDVNLELGPGAFVGVLGPNGAGKTTLLHGLLGLLPPLLGEVQRHGVQFGYVPQRENLDAVYPLTVDEVVRMGSYGRLSGWRRVAREDKQLGKELLRRVGLADRRRHRFARLSGGQRQRVLIARALVARPNLLVLDEPTTGVDQPTQELIVELLTQLNRDEGLAITLVSHQASMTQVVDQVLWVSDVEARLVSPSEVHAQSGPLGTLGIRAPRRGEGEG